MAPAIPPPIDAASMISSFGFSTGDVTPANKAERLFELQETLARKDVPWPVCPENRSKYFKLFQRGIPFGIGSLTDETVDLRQYRDNQVFDKLGWQEHLSWANLIRSQQQQKREFASREYLEGEKQFRIRGTTIPDYYLLNARIYQQTGWQLATVNEIIPADVFFHCHSRKFFPVTTFMRPLGTDYLEEPDIGHDIAGHVATFTIPEVAWVMNQHGLANELIHAEKEHELAQATSDQQRHAIRERAAELLLYAGRIYWFTVEFGLVLEEGKLKAFGAGILSSPGETRFSVESSQPNRILIDVQNDQNLLRLATTDYLISEYQKTYFVMRDFASLRSLTAQRIFQTVKQAARLPHYAWRDIGPSDDLFNTGECPMHPNDKYLSSNGQAEMDECVRRTAARNMAMREKGFTCQTDAELHFLKQMPPIPSV